MDFSDNKKNLFVLLSRVPYPLEKGDKLRAYHQIRLLSESYNVFVFAFYEGRLSEESVRRVSEYCVDYQFYKLSFSNRVIGMVNAILSGLPFQTAYFSSFSAQKEIFNAITKFKTDFIYVQLIRVAHYVAHCSLPKVIDFQDALSKNMERRAIREKGLFRMFFKNEANRIARFEKKLLGIFDRFTIISQADKEAVVALDNESVIVVPNGVDTDYFSPLATEKDYVVSFVGNMGYAPNVDACTFLVENIMPHVWKKYPESRLVLAGANPSNEVINLRSEKVIVTGWVDDIRPYYAASQIFVAPLRMGSGMQNKILEAMSMELPCVTTTLAASPIGGINSKDFLVADTAEEVADAILFLMENSDRGSEIAKNARSFVLEKYAWRSQTSKLIELFKEL
jgi:sugar transferase (PEP-CTERM/EpsH1 system associated)